jgi:DNA-binding MarR family transcriptional regulator
MQAVTDETMLLTLQTIAQHAPVTVGGVALLLNTDRNLVSQRIDQLVWRGLARRERSTTDLEIHLHTTPAGTAFLAQA